MLNSSCDCCPLILYAILCSPLFEALFQVLLFCYALLNSVYFFLLYASVSGWLSILLCTFLESGYRLEVVSDWF